MKATKVPEGREEMTIGAEGNPHGCTVRSMLDKRMFRYSRSLG
jgi:hypothetical protein